VAIYIFIENYSGNFLFFKTEIATPAFGGLAMTEGGDCNDLLSGKLAM
jgi:hypothetical protein